jgi:large exoprotein involved in heme utilization and adhesion
LSAPSGRLNLASLASGGEVIPTASSLIFSAGTQGGLITVKNTLMTVSGNGSSGIFIRGGNFELINSQIDGSTLGDQNGGPINILVDRLSLTEAANIINHTRGLGNAGNIKIKTADALTLSGFNKITGWGSSIISNTFSEEDNAGHSGRIEINAYQINLTDEARISSSTWGAGNGGDIFIKVADKLNILSSLISGSSLGESDNAGHAGNIDIEARQINLTDGAQIVSGTIGPGDGGTIKIKVAETLTISGTDKDGNFASGVFGNSRNEEIDNAGHAGNIEIEAQQLILTDGATIRSDTWGTGQGGTITLSVDHLEINNLADISGSTWGAGQGTSIIIKASTLSLSNSRILSQAEQAGNAGYIEIEAHHISLTGGADISGNTWESGNAATIVIKGADTLTLSSSDILSMSKGAGKAGNIDINARKIILTNKGDINNSSVFSGESGTIKIKTDTLTFSSGGTILSSNHEGDGGQIEINARQIIMTGSSVETTGIGANSFETGNGGTIIIKVDETLTLSNADIYSMSLGNGNAGHIEIDARKIILTGSSSAISTHTSSSGKAGTIIIRTGILTLLDEGVIFSLSDGTGKGGRIEINAEQITLSDKTVISTSTFGSGVGGDIIVKTDSLTLSGDAAISSTGSIVSTGKGGSIEINAEQVTLSNTARIDTNTFGIGDAGRIVVKTDDLTLSGDATISSGNLSIATGKGGGIEINAKQVTLSDKTEIDTSTSGIGDGGMVVIKTDDLTLSGNATISSRTFLGSTGKGGRIEINAEQVTLSNTASIDTSTSGSGEGGMVVVKTDDLTISGDATISSRSDDYLVFENDLNFEVNLFENLFDIEITNAGNAGNLSVQANIIRLLDGGKISTETNNAAGGNINIITPNLLYLREGSITTSVSGGTGDGGNIDIKTPVFVVLDGAKIIAQADEGRGGNITIDSDWFWSSTDAPNIVDASSQQNVSGTVEIVGSEDDIIGTIKLLPATFFNAETLLKSQCGALTRRDLSSIVVVGRETRPTAPDDFKTHVIQVTDVYKLPSGALDTSYHKKSQHSPQRILRVECAESTEFIPPQLF